MKIYDMKVLAGPRKGNVLFFISMFSLAYPRKRPSASKFFNFHAVFGK